jgi:hypothetical protein
MKAKPYNALLELTEVQTGYFFCPHIPKELKNE